MVGKDGAKPVKVDKLDNDHIIGLTTVVKKYEKLTVQAAMNGDDAAALNALMIHPLVGDFNKAKACYEEMKFAHGAFLPQFKK